MTNVIGSELRKLASLVAKVIERQGLMETAAMERTQRIEAQLTALRADADYGAQFTQIKCLLDLTNKRLKALELSRRSSLRRPRKKKREHKRT